MPPVANTLLTTTEVLQESLFLFENNLVAGSFVNKEYSNKFAVEGAKIGDTLTLRDRPRYLVTSGSQLVRQESKETPITLTLEFQEHIGLEFSSRDLTLSIDRFSDRFLSSAVAALAAKFDQRVLATAREFYNVVGTPGTIPNTLRVYLQGGALLSDGAVPTQNRAAFLTPDMEVELVDALKGLFHQSTQIANQYLNGQMGRAAGLTFYMDQQCPSHTSGPQGGTPVVSGAGQTGSLLATSGWTAAAGNRLKKGDRFTIDGVQSVNLYSREATGKLQYFVCTADFDSDATGAGTIAIDPPIIPTGQYQTVNQAPANGAAITVVGAGNITYKLGLILQKDAVTAATADLFVPNGADMAGRLADDQLGISMRLWREGDIDTDSMPTRLDILFGVAILRKSGGCVIASKS